MFNYVPVIPIDKDLDIPEKPLSTTNNDAWRKNGMELAKELVCWIGDRFNENPNLKWSQQEQWNAALLRSDIIPRFDFFHCSHHRACDDLPHHEEDFCGKKNHVGHCDRWIQINVFDYAAPIGDDLKLLARYLDPRKDLPIFEDLEERHKYVSVGGDWGCDYDVPPEAPLLSEAHELRVKIKVIWAFALRWIRENVFRQLPQPETQQGEASNKAAAANTPIEYDPWIETWPRIIKLIFETEPTARRQVKRGKLTVEKKENARVRCRLSEINRYRRDEHDAPAPSLEDVDQV